ISFTYPPTSYLCPSMLAWWPTIFLSYRVSSVALFPTFLFRYIFHASIYTFHHHFSRLMHAYCILASHTPAFNPLRSSFFRLPISCIFHKIQVSSRGKLLIAANT
ncbi:unnamed protein product, partial [Pylaiella littoralis]